MGPPTPKHTLVLAFDLYGTILSTESIAKELAKQIGNHYNDHKIGEDEERKANTVAATWRKYQLEYTWRLNSMKKYVPFSTITEQSLQHALAESSLSLSATSIRTLLQAYDTLELFPDVSPALESLSVLSSSSISSLIATAASDTQLDPVIFSNGTDSMVTNSVHHSPSLSPYSGVFNSIITVDEAKAFKPAPEVYYHLAKEVGKGKDSMNEIVLISGNPFDIVGAKGVGMRAIWVDRAGRGWEDRLVDGTEGKPDRIVKGLGEVVDVAQEWI